MTLNIVLVIWLVLVMASLFAPMRWSVIAFLVLSTVDFAGGNGSFAIYNVFKGIALPVYMLYRLRAYAGHTQTIVAPFAWVLLMAYVTVATLWSVFPQSGFKLVGHMAGSLLIVLFLSRATKGGFLTVKAVVPVTIGAIGLACICKYYLHGWGDDPSRLTSFMPAQAFAAFLGALYCIALCGKGLRTSTRVWLCSALAMAVVMNGSRIWFTGILLATFGTLALSHVRFGWKLLATVASVTLFFVLLAGADRLVDLMGGPNANRIASALSAFYRGDTYSTGLGTFNFRKEIDQVAIDSLENSSASEFVFGRGTCNGALITGSMFSVYSSYSDPNRMFHNEWLRVAYEWGAIGSIFWLAMMGSLLLYAYHGWRIDPDGNAKVLLVYFPSFMIALSGENIIAGAGSAVSVGFLWAIALTTMAYRDAARNQMLSKVRSLFLLSKWMRLREQSETDNDWAAAPQS